MHLKITSKIRGVFLFISVALQKPICEFFLQGVLYNLILRTYNNPPFVGGNLSDNNKRGVRIISLPPKYFITSFCYLREHHENNEIIVFAVSCIDGITHKN